jgi:cell division protein FtsL
VRGFRLVDLIAVGVLASLILGVYLAKTIAGRERAEIATIDRKIEAEQARIRLLQAEVSHLEQPARIEALSERLLGLAPVPAQHGAGIDQLSDLAGRPLPASTAPVALTPDPMQTAAPQAPEPLPVPTQMAAVSGRGVAR